MIVVGGTYFESCSFPAWAGLFGSGVRAALAISSVSEGTQLRTYVYRESSGDLQATMAAFGVSSDIVEIAERLEFEYWHPLYKNPAPRLRRAKYEDLVVEGDVVLGFGMLEGRARITCKRAVYDPRTADWEDSFRASGSKAGELAYVIQDNDLIGLGQLDDPRDAASYVMNREGAKVVVSRHPFGGATVYQGDARGVSVPSYVAPRWFRIGAGDVFCAAFAHHWGERGLDAVRAADLASRSVAYFNDGGRLPLPEASELDEAVAIPSPEGADRRVYLSGPRRTMSQRYLFDEAAAFLNQLGVSTETAFETDDARAGPKADWPPIPRPAHSALLALGDVGEPATNFHVGYAKAHGYPVVLLAESASELELATFRGKRCEVAHDLASALYRARLACLV